MVKSVNNLILDEVNKLVDSIKETKDYQDYLFLSNKLKENDKALEYIDKIKKLQKEIVKKEVNGEDVTSLEHDISNLLDKLNKIPLYVEYINKQKELNEEYQIIKNTLDDYFYELFN